MKIITMGTLKGGAGKTMNVFNLAGVLAKNNKVLLIDVDPQCNLSSNCGIDVADVKMQTIRDIFSKYQADKQPKAEEVIIKSPISELKNLDIIPSSILLFEIEDDITLLEGRSFILKNFIRRNKEVLENYDYILIDTNPSMSVFNINAFYVADSIIISSDVSGNSISGAELFCSLWDAKREQINETADNPKEDNIAALLIGNYDKRTNLSKELLEYVNNAEFSKDIVISEVIPATVKCKDAELVHTPVNVLYPNEDITGRYKKVVKELKTKGVL